MTARLGEGLALALVSTCAINLGFFVQHGAAAGVETISLRRPFHSLRVLFTNTAWVLGNVAGLAGWGLYLWALALAPLSLVQAVSAGGVAVLALATWRLGHTTLTRRELSGVIGATAGLALLGASLSGSTGSGHMRTMTPLWVWLALSVVSASAAAGPLASRLGPGAGLGVAAGLMYAAGDITTKAAFDGRAWLWPVLLACHATAFAAIQIGFQRGGTLATAGTASLFLNSLPIVAGVALFHEGFPSGILGAVRVIAFALVVAGAVLLARGETVRGSTPEGVRVRS